VHLWDRPRVPSSLIDFYAMVTGRTLPASNPFQQWNRWYFGTDTRLDSLLIGCSAAVLLAWSMPRIGARTRASAPYVVVASLIGLGVIVANATILDSWLPQWGLVVLEVLVACAVVALVIRPDSWPARLLSIPALVWLGRRSYSVYLFHQVVFYELGGGRVNIPQPWQFVVMITVVLLVAEFSWRVIERPFLARKQRFEPSNEVMA
jgi:peptidoglycan/LPS O-acetylase OafA/YrhL